MYSKYDNMFGGDTLIMKETSKEAPKQYNLRRNTRIRSHPYQENNMLILTKKFKNLSLEDVYISKNFEDKKRATPQRCLCDNVQSSHSFINIFTVFNALFPRKKNNTRYHPFHCFQQSSHFIIHLIIFALK